MSTQQSSPFFVVDASVVLKWTLEEELSEKAQEVLDDYLAGRISLLAPANILYEVPGALRAAVLRNRLMVAQAREAIRNFLDLEIPTFGGSDLTLAAYDLSFRLTISFYDALYAALAEATGFQLLYADNRLRQSVGHLPTSLFLADY